MNQRELIIRVLAAMRTDLAAKEFELEGILKACLSSVDYSISPIEQKLERASMDLAGVREYIEEVILILQ